MNFLKTHPCRARLHEIAKHSSYTEIPDQDHTQKKTTTNNQEFYHNYSLIKALQQQ